nr:hypothetical protein CFP56_20440 [Quercus suber]
MSPPSPHLVPTSYTATSPPRARGLRHIPLRPSADHQSAASGSGTCRMERRVAPLKAAFGTLVLSEPRYIALYTAQAIERKPWGNVAVYESVAHDLPAYRPDRRGFLPRHAPKPRLRRPY